MLVQRILLVLEWYLHLGLGRGITLQSPDNKGLRTLRERRSCLFQWLLLLNCPTNLYCTTDFRFLDRYLPMSRGSNLQLKYQYLQFSMPLWLD